MRLSSTTNIDRRISFNSFLLSVFLNLVLLLILSLCRENIHPQTKDALDVNLVSLPRTLPQRRSLDLPDQRMDIPVPRDVEPDTVRVKSILRSRELSTPQSGSVVIMNVDPASNQDPDTLSSSVTARRQSISPLSNPAGALRRGEGVPSETGRGTGEYGGPVGRGIVPPKPMAGLSGTGRNLSGYYNISLVRYEDTSDTISTDALRQLAGAMNRWTEIKTKVIREPIMLDDPELLRVPLVYITSRRAFAFSERERENLRKYLAGGGFLLFTNAADSESEARGVANSIEFELWKVASGSTYDLVDMDERSRLYNSFFDLPDSLVLRGIPIDGRFCVVYEDSGYGTIWAAAEGRDRDKYLKLGVNIIAYALTTSPLVPGNQ